MFTVNIVNEKGFNIDLVQRQGLAGLNLISTNTDISFSGSGLIGFASGKATNPSAGDIRTLLGLSSIDTPTFNGVRANTFYRADGNTGIGSNSLADVFVAINGTQIVGSGNVNECAIRQAAFLGFSSSTTNTVVGIAAGWRFDGNNIIGQRNGAAGQIYRVYKTFTASNNFETFEIDAVTDLSNYRIGHRTGSVNNVARGLQLGAYDGAGTWTSWLSFATSGNATLAGRLHVQGVNAATIQSIIQGAASQSANLTEWQNSAGSILASISSGGIIMGTSVRTDLIQRNTGNLTLQLYNATTNGFALSLGSTVFNNSSGVAGCFNFSTTYNQTGTAGSNDIQINRTETALGSGVHNFINCQVGGVSRFVVSNLGNTGIGVTPTARFHVRGSGTTSATTSFIIEDSGGSNWLSARDDRMFNVTGTQSFNNGANISPSSGGDGLSSSQLCGLRFRSVLTLSDINSEFFFRNSNGNRSFTSSFGSLMEFSGGFAPTSGTGTYSIARFTGTINQTGGANGITQGVLVSPTLTAAADWRSYDTNVNSGFAYHSSGTAPSRLGGGLTWVPFTTSQTPAANGQFTIELTSNTAGNLVYRGSDGVTRRMPLTFT